MKTITKGVIPQDYPKRIKCPKCKSILEYTKEDVKNNIDPRDNINDYYIDCPVCKHQPTVNP